MANDALKVAEKVLAEDTGAESLIDPIYQKFVRSVTRAIGSTEFYQYFMNALSGADNELQFSNRKVVKTVDTVWVDAVEGALESFQKIVAAPRNVIQEEELIVNVANAKKARSETVRHLAQHAALVEDFNDETGDVRPSKLMQRYREDSIGQYENRLVFTTMEIAHRFVQIRYDALMEQMGDEYGAKLKIRSDMESATEHVHMDMFMHIKEIDSALDTDRKHNDVFNRISRTNRVLTMLMNTDFAQQLSKLPRVKGTINKTNVLKRNKSYHQVMLLYEFLKSYSEVGYSIDIVEQAPEIDERFEEDIYRNILFNYLVLKGYLQDEEDRMVPVEAEEKKQSLHPKFIKEIIEELTEDYDLTDVEIRKVLIEELTREQLMQEEAAERLRLVEEKEAQMTEEERIAEFQRKLEQEMQRQKDERYRERYILELDYFREHLQERLMMRRREEEASGLGNPKEDFADAALLLEAAEKQRHEAEIEALRQVELAAYKSYMEEISYFWAHLEVFKEQREQEEEEQRHAEELRQLARQERMQELQSKKQSLGSSLLKWRRG
ncbi:MAG: DUF2357 domain-containing protein [Oscillospiraceae bacterium]|nr:DUF2357 domain-containing protein [Oscillospiraceae bacterium]